MVADVRSTKVLMDAKRLKALKETFLLDTKAEAAFDRLTNMAARILGAPISLISLIDIDRQFIKSSEGTDITELPLSHSFCQHVVTSGNPLIIEDARQHPLVSTNPAVSDYDVIGYLGLPIQTTDGYNIGSLCVIDHKPRKWSQEEIKIIEDITSSVMMEIELRVQMRMEKAAGRKLSTTEIYTGINQDDNHFGVYKIIQKIGRGGMSDVYLCKHDVLNTLVAVKLLRDNPHQYEEFLQRFQQEAQIIASLKHPNIIRVFDYGVQDTAPYMVMEYIQGEDLETFLERNEQLTFLEDGAILLDLADALDFAHKKGIIHRDIKPGNVMLRRRFRDGQPTDQFHATLMDFGIAKLKSQERNMTADNLVGTVSYMSPEQIESADEIDHRADIYSLGVLAYRFLTGHLPFEGSLGKVLNQHLTRAMPDPRQFAPELSDSQVAALRSALSKNPADRPATAREFIIQLGR